MCVLIQHSSLFYIVKYELTDHLTYENYYYVYTLRKSQHDHAQLIV